jgi:hypothetical protein
MNFYFLSAHRFGGLCVHEVCVHARRKIGARRQPGRSVQGDSLFPEEWGMTRSPGILLEKWDTATVGPRLSRALAVG